jgi:hypothetical protein
MRVIDLPLIPRNDAPATFHIPMTQIADRARNVGQQ